jgi:hypothetical protein
MSQGPGSANLQDFTIIDQESFEAATQIPREIAGIYFFQALDYLFDLAYEISCDARSRPQLYKRLDDLKEPLANLRARYGSEPQFLSHDQRADIFLPIFGSWNATSSSRTDSFPQLRDELFQAAAAFAERQSNTGEAMLRASMRDIVLVFQEYLTGLEGDSTQSSEADLAAFADNTCYPILRSERIAAAFGVSKQAADNYPFGADPGMDVFIEEATKKLQQGDPSRTIATRRVTSNRQTAARTGAAAIATVLAFTGDAQAEDANLDKVTLRCYQWATALRSLAGEVTAGQPSLVAVPGFAQSPMATRAGLVMARPAGFYRT